MEDNRFEYKKELLVTYTDTDTKLYLGMLDSVSFAQSMVTEYFGKIGTDNIVLREKNNAAWVITKTRVHFEHIPFWQDKIIATSYTTKVANARVNVETKFTDRSGKLLFYFNQESCPIDLDLRKIRKIDDINYPKDMEIKDAINSSPFLRLKDEFSEENKAYSQVVYSQDIDYSQHVNNVVYVRYILNTLSCKFLRENNIKDFEIHYISESTEGQTLDVYKKEEKRKIEFLIKENNREVVRAFMTYEKM